MAFKKRTPDWFDIDNYEFIKNLNSQEIVNQITMRKIIIGEFYFISDGMVCCQELHAELINKAVNDYIKIMNGQPYLIDFFTEKAKKYKDNITSTSAITATSSEDAVHHYMYLEEKGYFAKNLKGESRYIVDREKFINNSLYIANRNIALVSDLYTRDLSINIDLENHTDIEILEQLKHLLPKWRDELNISNPTKPILKNNSYTKKVVECKLLPLFDLMIWCAVYSRKLSRNAIFSDVFNNTFNNKTIDDKAYDQTIKPTILKYIANTRDRNDPLLDIFNLKPL